MNGVHFLNVEYILTAIYEFFQNFDAVAIINWLLWLITLLRPIAFVVTLFLIGVCVYSFIKLKQLARAEKEAGKIAEVVETPAEQEKELNEKWVKVQEHINSSNPNDWRMAIIESDIILGEVLTKAGFRGDNIGDQLKSVAKGDMKTLDSAWEAHKVRNQIAHGGSDYQLNEREVKIAIGVLPYLEPRF
jgi:hypothetical protein